MKTFSLLVLVRNHLISKTGLFCSLILAATSLFSHQAYALDVECEIPLAVVCHVSDPKGFTSVTVNVDFGHLGMIDVVSNSFPNCRTEAIVSWDPITPNFQITTTPCSGGELTLGRRDDIERTNPTYASGRFANNVARPAANESADPRRQTFGIGVSQLQTNGGLFASVKFCDNHKVDDDIAACDIGEIAWECPDGASGPSEACEADVNGLFD